MIVSRETLRKIAGFAAAMLLCGGLSSCGGPAYSEDEIKNALNELLPLSFELNEIYFGEGLPISDDRDEVEQFYASFDTDVRSVNYHPVAKDCPYQTEKSIREATEKVFTADYCEYLYAMAFSGISDVFNPDTERQTTVTASYARYLETDGVLTVRLDLPDEAMELGRTYDVEKMEIVRTGIDTVKEKISYDTERGTSFETGATANQRDSEQRLVKADYVVVRIPTEFHGETLDVELRLVMTNDGFRLDTPTY